MAVDGSDKNLYLNEDRGRPGVKVERVETGETFNSITDCAAHINGSAGTIHDVISGRRNTHKGYKFKLTD